MRRLIRRRDERGATLVFVVIAMVTILAATCLGVDTSSAVYQKGRLQHAADAAAFAIAKDCIENGTDPCADAGDDATVDEFIASNTNGGGAITSRTVDQDPDDHVTVDITRAVDLFFGPAIGVTTKDVTAHARVEWQHAVSGSVIPYAVSVCEYLKEKSGSGDGYLNTGINNNNPAPPGIGYLGGLDQGDPESSVEPYMDSCMEPEPYNVAVKTVRDGLWISDTSGTEYCNSKTDVAVNSVHLARPLPTACTKNQVDNFDGVGSTVLFAVYGPAVPPAADYLHGGACTVSGLLDNDGCTSPNAVGSSPNFAVKILGFVPFEVTGYCLGGPAPECAGDYDSSKRGFWGEIIATTEILPDVIYGDQGADLDAIKISLVE